MQKPEVPSHDPSIQKILEKFEPYGAVLLCLPIVVAEKTAGGIIIPEQCRNPLNQGRVIAVGTSLDKEEWPTGMIVLYSQHSENRLKIDGQDLVTITLDNVILRSTPANNISA